MKKKRYSIILDSSIPLQKETLEKMERLKLIVGQKTRTKLVQFLVDKEYKSIFK